MKRKDGPLTVVREELGAAGAPYRAVKARRPKALAETIRRG